MKLGIVLLQETHSSGNFHANWRKLLKGQFFFHDKDSNTAGIAFLLFLVLCIKALSHLDDLASVCLTYEKFG